MTAWVQADFLPMRRRATRVAAAPNSRIIGGAGTGTSPGARKRLVLPGQSEFRLVTEQDYEVSEEHFRRAWTERAGGRADSGWRYIDSRLARPLCGAEMSRWPEKKEKIFLRV